MRGAYYCLFATNFNNVNTISKYWSTIVRFYIPYDINDNTNNDKNLNVSAHKDVISRSLMSYTI